MEGQKAIADRRGAFRHRMRAPVFAIFDGVSSGMILDLSEQGLAMLAPVQPDSSRAIPLKFNLSDPATEIETTGYVAWADTLGRAGVRFSDLPIDARLRLKEWLEVNAGSPAHKAPKFTLDESLLADLQTNLPVIAMDQPRAVDFELEPISRPQDPYPAATTVQFEFASLGPDLDSVLQKIAERAQTLTRATGAALALRDSGLLICRASVGDAAPTLGATVDVNRGVSGGCVRTGNSVRCDDAAADPRVDSAVCDGLGIRSIVAAPIQYDRQTIGLLEVFSSQPFAFDDGDVAIVERLARTALLSAREGVERDKS